MKPTQIDSPRLSCRVIRQWQAISCSDPLRSSHVAGCADCRAYFKSGDNWEMALKRDAVKMRSAVPSGLDQRIFAAIRDSSERPKPARFKAEKIALASFGALAAAIAVGFYLRSPANFLNQDVSEAQNRADAAELISATQSVSKQLWRKFEPSAFELATTNPLQTEIDSVYADAQSAVGFLALNFLPSSTQKNVPESPPTGAPQRG